MTEITLPEEGLAFHLDHALCVWTPLAGYANSRIVYFYDVAGDWCGPQGGFGPRIATLITTRPGHYRSEAVYTRRSPPRSKRGYTVIYKTNQRQNPMVSSVRVEALTLVDAIEEAKKHCASGVVPLYVLDGLRTFIFDHDQHCYSDGSYDDNPRMPSITHRSFL